MSTSKTCSAILILWTACSVSGFLAEHYRNAKEGAGRTSLYTLCTVQYYYYYYYTTVYR